MVTSAPYGNRRRRWPCLLVPYLIQFTEVSKCRIAPTAREVSSVGWKHAKHFLQMDSEFDVVVVMEPAALHSEKERSDNW